MVIRPIVILLVICANPALMQGQKVPGPTGLRTDLVEHTDRVWQNGDLSTVRLEQYLKDTSRYQVVKIESKFPAFSWVLNDDRRGVSQKSYRIIVASDLKNIEFQDRNPSEEELENLKIDMEDDLFAPFLKSAEWKKGVKN